MKKIVLSFLICISAFGQNMGKVASTITELQKENVRFEKHSFFLENPNPVPSDYQKTVENTTIALLDLPEVNTIVAAKKNYLEIEIPYLDELISVLLFKVETQSENFYVATDKNPNVITEKGVHYRGIIKGDLNSLVSINFFENEVNGIIANGKYGNLIVGKLNVPNNLTHYIIYSDKDLKISNDFRCSPSEILPKALPAITQNRQANLTENCVTAYFEIDYDLYVANGSSINQTTNWINSVFNNVQTLFSNDQIKTALRSVFIWTTPDPYAGSNVYSYLYQFKNVRPFFDGDVGQLLTTGTGFGGVAAVVGGLCSENNFCYSDIDFSFSAVPAFSWTVQSITHELGHLLGSPHTHDCLWNNNNTPIDGCGPSIGYAGLNASGGTCTTVAPNPTNGGTIMSYCYAVNGIGNNFANGFGSQPAARIAQHVESSNCLGSDCINTCIATISNITASQITMNNASISWTDNNSENTSWQVSAAAYPFIPGIWTTVNASQTYTFTTLEPNTYYRFFVRNNCENLESTPITTNYIATLDNFCAGKPFTDTGGTLNNYGDYQDWTRIISPETTNSAIKVTFTSIDIEDGYDFLHIYNGQSTSNTELVSGGITGNAIVGPFTSTDVSGALTFRFISDTNTNGAGWNAILECESLGINQQELIDFSYFPNPVQDEILITSKTEINSISIFSIDGRMLYVSNFKQFDAKINMSDFASGTYIFKLQFDSKPVTFKVIRQ